MIIFLNIFLKKGKLENGRRFTYKQIEIGNKTVVNSNVHSNVLLFLFNDSIAVAVETNNNKDLKLLTFLKWHSEATNVWVNCKENSSDIKDSSPPSNSSDKSSLEHSFYLSDSFFHFKRHVFSFPKSSTKDSWKNDILDSIHRWKDFGR